MNFSFLIVLILFLSSGVNAQEEVADYSAEVSTNKIKYTSQKKKKNSTPYHFRYHRTLSATYTGFAIELVQSDIPLNRNYLIFKQFGRIYYEKLPDGNGYAYCIKVPFDEQMAVEKFLKSTVLHRAPEAKIIQYKNGKRINEK